MITLESNTLKFNFPDIAAELRRLVEVHIQSVLPRLLAEDRGGVAESYWAYRQVDAEARKQIEERVRMASPVKIEEALRASCNAVADFDGKDSFAGVDVNIQRTLRIPDNGETHPLPAGIGRFPLRHVDEFKKSVPESWLKRGGVMMPMYQSEALWLNFDARYPFAIKVGAGKINAATGEAWIAGLQRDPQNYLVLPDQPWLDGFAVAKGIIRQFVAMPLGDGYSVEEQLSGSGDVGGIQLQVFPMKVDAYFQKRLVHQLPSRLIDILDEMIDDRVLESVVECHYLCASSAYGMGLGAGGKMRQEIYKDRNDFSDWNTNLTSRCFIHLCNSLVWRQITGSNPPHPPITAKEYERWGVPWFDYYRDDLGALDGAESLAGVKSIAQMGDAKGTAPLPENVSIVPTTILQYGNARRPDEVREWMEP